MRRFSNILCVIGPESNEDVAFTRSVELANQNQAQLFIVKVIDKIPFDAKLEKTGLSLSTVEKEIRSQHQQELDLLAKPLRKSINVQVKVIIETPFLGIIREVLSNNCDLVIKTADAGGLLDRIFGSDDMHLLRKCPCPVWLVNPPPRDVNQRIVAAVDISYPGTLKETKVTQALNHQILEMSLSLASSENAELHILCVWQAVGEGILSGQAGLSKGEVAAYVADIKQDYQQDLDSLVHVAVEKVRLADKTIPHPQIHLIKGSPRHVIPSFVEELNADIVIMGTVCRTGVAGFLMGNTAETVLNQLNSSLIAVKPPGFITPVKLGD